jgi:hypothetical protein
VVSDLVDIVVSLSGELASELSDVWRRFSPT